MGEQIDFVALDNVPGEQIEANKAVNRGRGIPKVGDFSVLPRLAIVGGGSCVSYYIEELKNFDGDVWAINGAYEWCKSVGIIADFYAIDPSPLILPLIKNVHSAILADTVHQDVFENLKCKVSEIAWLGSGYITNGSTAASTAPMIAAERGHKQVVFYGCQSNFNTDSTHIYKNDKLSKIWLTCGNYRYITCPQFIMQAEFLAELARSLPKSIIVKGRGFLSSLIEHGTYNVTHVNKSINDGFKRKFYGSSIACIKKGRSIKKSN
jgi:hypothetical protein